MYHHLSPQLQAFNRPTQRPAPSWPNSSTGRTLHQHPRGQGLNPCPGAVSRKSRELFGPEKPFVKVRPAYSVKLVFSYVVKGIKIKIIAKFRASRRLRIEDTKRIMSPEIRPKSFGTFEKQAPGLNFSGLSHCCISSTNHSLCALFPFKYSTPPLLSKICTLLLCFLAGAKEGVKNLPRKITFLGRGQAVDWKQAYKELLMYYRELAEAKLAEQEKNG